MKKWREKRGYRYATVFFILFLILAAMTVQPMMTNVLGEEIVIQTKPFDPRDLFRGDYVQLDYAINEISLEKLGDEMIKLKGEEPYASFEGLRKEKLYVVLKKTGKLYGVDQVTLKKPKTGIFLKAKYSYPLWEDRSKEQNVKVKGIRVTYTLDKYFVPENTGKALEEKARKGELFAKIKVYKGYGLLKEIIE
ncbi:GDYXXLXY domain-containing protein [Clostridiaceae bacterium 35-E11]